MSDVTSYSELLTVTSDEGLINEEREEKNRFLQLNVDLFNAIKQELSQEKIEAIKTGIKIAQENVAAIQRERQNRGHYDSSDEPTPEQMTNVLNRAKIAAMRSTLDLAQDITEMISTAMSMALRVASDLPTEERYEPMTQQRALIEQSKNAATLMVRLWEELQNAQRLAERSLNSIELARRALEGEIALQEGQPNPYPDELPF